jgi:hypothetical protein
MKTQLKTVSPAQASKWLKEANVTNRVIRMAHVNRLKNTILSGKWIVTHQGIAFAEDGTLIDGQHRLMAIEAAGKPVDVLVTTGMQKFHNGDVNLNTMDVIDCGKPRTTADQLHLLHNVTYPHLSTAIARCISVALCKGAKASRTLDVSQALGILSIYGDDIAKFIGIAIGSKLCKNAAILGALAIASQVNPDHAELFLRQLKSGSGIKEGDPVYAVRESLIRDSAAGSANTSLEARTALLHKITMAIYNTIQGTPIKLAKVNTLGLEYFMTKQPDNVAAVKALFLL